MSIESGLRRLLPRALLALAGKARRRIRDYKYSKMSLQETFTHIYKTNAWGGKGGSHYSGRGSAQPRVAASYVDAARSFIGTIPLEQREIVDLGCGDFRIGEQLIADCRLYTGTDIVPDLIATLRQRGYGANVRFEIVNIVSDPLPTGKVCVLRQVLQHLSNHEIAQVLPKLRQYDYVLLTEHFPTDAHFVQANIDKSHGPHIRREYGSAVCIDRPPFNVPSAAMRLLSEVPGDGTGDDPAAGIIRTYVLPGAAIPAAASPSPAV